MPFLRQHASLNTITKWSGVNYRLIGPTETSFPSKDTSDVDTLKEDRRVDAYPVILHPVVI